MQNLIKSLDKKVSARYAGTGTLYVEFQGKKIRIGNHEPNEAMRKHRGMADLELYTHDLVGKEINSKYDIVEKVADFLNLEITGATKAAITRFRNKEMEENKRLIEIQRINKSQMDEVQNKIKEFHSKIRKLTKGKEKELKQLFVEAEKYGDLGSNGQKRRKRRVSYFKKEFKNRFGIEATPYDVETALQTVDYKTEIDKTVLQATNALRDKTKESYRIVNEKKGGLNISDRVWKYNEQIKKEMEIAIQNGIKQGKSADDIARDMQKYLNNPESLFRRVRDKETDKLSLSKSAKEYHPGQGVYRSAYKNAMRLIVTEINAAYREAEWASYQNNPLIKGFEIRLSNNHTIMRNGKRVPFYDICDELQGIYPKTYKWTGWHPHCYSNDTEVLTNKGWKLFKDVEREDLIFSLNPDNKEPEYVGWVNSYSYKYEGKMILFNNRALNLLVTPDHSMIYLNKSNGMIMDNKFALDYQSTTGALYRSSEYNNKDIPFIEIGKHLVNFDLFCEFMGYWLADGYTVSTRKNTFGISQTKKHDPKTYSKIVELSKKLPFHYNCEKERIIYHDSDMYKYLLQFGKVFDKYIPIDIKESATYQIKIFLNAFLCCDGSIRPTKTFIGNRGTLFISNSEEIVYYTSSKQLAADIGELLVKIGKRPSYSIISKKGTACKFKNGIYKTNADCWRIAECKGKTASVFNKSFIDYNDFVYDLELEKNHILYVRRNGKCVWGSNCRCVMIPILLTEKEFASRVKARKEGKLNEWKADEIKDMPEKYNKYIKENKDRLDKLKNKPSWLIDDKLNEESPNIRRYENNIKEATTKE